VKGAPELLAGTHLHRCAWVRCAAMERNKAHLRLLFGVGLVLTLTSAVMCPQEPTFTVDVQLVRLLATVKDADGKLIGNLQGEDFIVYDNDVRQEISVFERYTEQPLSVALLIDASGSTAKELKYELESASRFLRSIIRGGNPRDAVALFTFNWEIRQQTTFTRRLDQLESAMRGIKAEGGTSLYDALHLSTGGLAGREGRHVVVVVTDGGDTTSSKTYHEALEALQRADAIVYAIVVMPITNDAGRNIGGENALTTLARSTGGRVFSPADAVTLDRAFDDIIRDLRTQYLIAYYPKNIPFTKDSFHRVDIRVKRPELIVTTRTGYFRRVSVER
jgi:Ca-activated chloride channel homolog